MAATFSRTGRNIICIGRNYVDHVKELNNKVPLEPFYFLKPTSSYLEKGKGGIEIPKGVLAHYEVELGIIIGKGGRNISQSAADSHIAGYTLAIDMTARNMQEAVKSKGLPWSAAKGFDTWSAVGRFIPKSEIADDKNVGLWLKVNGVEKQRGTSGEMIFGIPRIIEHVSSIMSLSEGDLIMTGTPSGVGPVVPGDKIEVGLTYPGLDGPALEQIEWDVVAREGGYEFKGK